MKNARIFITGLIVGAMLMIGTSIFADGLSEIKAYVRDGFTFKVNGKVVALESPPIVYNNSTYLPVRELAGLLSHDVGFGDNTIALDIQVSVPAKTTITTPVVEEVKKVEAEPNPVQGDDSVTTITAEWISIRDLMKLNAELNITIDGGKMYVKNGDLHITFVMPETRFAIPSVISSEEGGYSLKIMNGGSYLNISELTPIGIVVQ